jgi:hypothetical protein
LTTAVAPVIVAVFRYVVVAGTGGKAGAGIRTGTDAGVGGAAVVVMTIGSALDWTVGTGMRTEGGTGVDTCVATGAAESKIAGVVAVTVRAGVHKVVL